MSKRKSQTAIADYRAEGFVHEALVNYLALLGWSPGTEEELLVARRPDRALRPRPRPQGRRRLRPGTARVAERPVDPPAVRRRPGRALAAVPRGASSSAGRIVRTAGRRTSSCRSLPVVRERLPRLGAIGDLVDFLFVDERRARPGAARPQALGRGDDARGPPSRARVIADAGEVELRGRRAGAAAPRPRRGARLEGRRPVHGHPRRRHRPDGHAAPVRHARGARPRPDARPARPAVEALERRPSGRPEAEPDTPVRLVTHPHPTTRRRFRGPTAVQDWLDRYVEAWKSYDPDRSAPSSARTRSIATTRTIPRTRSVATRSSATGSSPRATRAPRRAGHVRRPLRAVRRRRRPRGRDRHEQLLDGCEPIEGRPDLLQHLPAPVRRRRPLPSTSPSTEVRTPR